MSERELEKKHVSQTLRTTPFSLLRKGSSPLSPPLTRPLGAPRPRALPPLAACQLETAVSAWAWASVARRAVQRERRTQGDADLCLFVVWFSLPPSYMKRTRDDGAGAGPSKRVAG